MKTAPKTRKQLATRQSKINAKLCQLRDRLTALELHFEDGICALSHDAWNALYDMERVYNRALDQLETLYSRRNWTTADYASYDLIMHNID